MLESWLGQVGGVADIHQTTVDITSELANVFCRINS